MKKQLMWGSLAAGTALMATYVVRKRRAAEKNLKALKEKVKRPFDSIWKEEDVTPINYESDHLRFGGLE